MIYSIEFILLRCAHLIKKHVQNEGNECVIDL